MYQICRPYFDLSHLFMKREHHLFTTNVVTIVTLITPITLCTLVTLVILITLVTLVQGSDMSSTFWSSYLYLLFMKRDLLLREAPF